MQRHRPQGSALMQFMGWFGVVAILVAYMGATFGFFDASNVWYFILNLLGAFGIIVETRSRGDAQPMVLNIVWALVAMYGIIALVGR